MVIKVNAAPRAKEYRPPEISNIPDEILEEIPGKILKRDTGQTACYRWEAYAFPDSPHLAPPVVESLIRCVHSDVIRLVGEGAAHPDPSIYFDLRRDGACAKWGSLHFNKNGATIETVLHETGHSLTWNGRQLLDMALRKHTGTKLQLVQHHLSYVLCDQGHGPRFIAVLLALMQRYAGADLRGPVQLASERGVKIDSVALAYWQRLFGR